MTDTPAQPIPDSPGTPQAPPTTDTTEGHGRAPALQAVAASKVFSGVTALDAVDFAVHPGSIHALIGQNGAGKSTLIKVLTGAYRPDSGEIRYQGKPVHFSRPSEAQDTGISTVYQEVNLIPKLSIAQNIYLGREPRTKLGLIDSRRMQREARALLDGFGLQLDVGADLDTLGLGVQQMVALARAVTIDANVIVMDEPTSSLERREVETLFSVARRLRDEGKAIVFVSHRLDELWELCDRVTVLRDGKLVHTGPMASLGRRELISMMLGREIEEVARSGATSFGSEEHAAQTEAAGAAAMLVAEDLNAPGVLHHVNLSVRPGEVLGLAGLLGAGRSETVKAIYGALGTNAGQITVDGRRVKRNSISAAMDSGIALLSEDRKSEGIIPELSVGENIMLAVPKQVSTAGLISRSKAKQLADEYIKRLHIKVAGPDQSVAELSGGNQQKVLIARWLATQPKVFLMDEPTRGIDVGAKAEVQELIDELAASGYAVVLISSETEELVAGSDRAVVLRDGRVDAELGGADLTNQNLLATLVGADASQEGDAA
ncbi:MAG: sugar ABC transporter ATP-binding protein [Galactobacter sp.]